MNEPLFCRYAPRKGYSPFAVLTCRFSSSILLALRLKVEWNHCLCERVAFVSCLFTCFLSQSIRPGCVLLRTYLSNLLSRIQSNLRGPLLPETVTSQSSRQRWRLTMESNPPLRGVTAASPTRKRRAQDCLRLWMKNRLRTPVFRMRSMGFQATQLKI